jgi:polyvinyl alcohol dehydrogenase (cytochrome)
MNFMKKETAMKAAPLLLLIVAAAQGDVARAADSPASLYQQHCAVCHEVGIDPRAVPRGVLGKLPQDRIRSALTQGSMRAQGASLSPAEQDALVDFIASAGGASPSAAAPPVAGARCAAEKAPYTASLRAPHWSGWGVDLTQQRFQSEDQARLTAAEVPRLKLKWAFGYAGSISSSGQPSVVNGRLFVGNSNRKVYALNAASGCTYWTYDAEFPVRTAISVGTVTGVPVIFFGDQHATAYAVDAFTGAQLWKTHVDDYPFAIITGAPTLGGDVLYVPVASLEDAVGADPRYECCKFRGSVIALDAATGKVIWKASTVPGELKPGTKSAQGVQHWGPAGAGVWSSPTIDEKRRRLYVTTSNSTTDPPASTSDAFVAFDLKTGKLLWSRQMTADDGYNLACDLPAPLNSNCPSTKGPDYDFGSSAMLVSLGSGHRALIAGQKSGFVHAIDPDADGRILWQKSVGHGGRLGGVQWGSASDGKSVYVALSDAQIGPAAPGTPGAQPTFGTYMMFNPKAGGGLFALDARTGEQLWYTPHPGCGQRPGCSPGQSAAVTAIPGVVFSGGIDGILRAYSASDGHILWDVDTVREYETVNGEPAHGGSLNGPGAVIVNGMLYVNSGYVHFGTAPGNVLLAFSVDGK